MARYSITIRASDVAPAPADPPVLVLPASPYAGADPVSVTIQGAPAGAVLRLYDGDAVIWTGTAGGTGAAAAAVALAEGAHELAATAHPAGQLESVRTPVTFVVDRAPVATLSLPATFGSYTVPVTLAAPGAEAFILSEDPTPPAADDPRWGPLPVEFAFPLLETATPAPTVDVPAEVVRGDDLVVTVDVPADPARTLYAWARDPSGLISATVSADVDLNGANTPVPVLHALPTGVREGQDLVVVVDVPQDGQPAPASAPPYPDEITITSEGATLEPLLGLDVGAQVDWVRGDGEASSERAPAWAFGSVAQRVHRLRASWAGLRSLNLGYDAGDGGSTEIPLHPVQNVSAIVGLQNATALEYLTVNGNPITELDVGDLPALHTVECYRCEQLAVANVQGSTLLRRVCLEECDLLEMDVRGLPLLEDLRGALNRVGPVYLDPAYEHLWHICIRGNPTLSLPGGTDFTAFPALMDLWLYLCGSLTGTLRAPPNGALRSLRIEGDNFSVVDLTNAFPAGRNGQALLNSNPLTGLVLAGCPGLAELNVSGCGLTQALVDYVLATMDGFNTSGGTLDVSGNAAPSATGAAHLAALQARGWTVTT